MLVYQFSIGLEQSSMWAHRADALRRSRRAFRAFSENPSPLLGARIREERRTNARARRVIPLSFLFACSLQRAFLSFLFFYSTSPFSAVVAIISFSLALFVTCFCSCCRWLYCCCITKMRGRHFKAAALHGKTPRRDQNPVLAISSFGPIKTCATRSSSWQNTREPGSLRADQMNAWMTFQRSGPSRQNSQKRPEPGSRNLFLRANQDMRNAIIFTAKHPRARLSSGRSNERVDDIPTQRPLNALQERAQPAPTICQVHLHGPCS